MEQTTDPARIFVGLKPFMNYVTAVVMQFTSKNAQTVTIRARGKFISRAVDIAEVATKRFLESQVEIKNINTNSEDFKNREGRDVRVSTIEIVLGLKS
jgi:archaea-specific DNA-binding protein